MYMRALGYTKGGKNKLASPYLPDFLAASILDVDFGKLHTLGVTHVLLDLDQTLRLRNHRVLEEEIINFMTGIKEAGIFKNISIITNNRRDLIKFSQPLHAQVFQPYREGGKSIRKPNPIFFAKVLEELAIKPHKAVMIGDKVYTDTLGANKAGIITVLVTPRGPDYWYDRLLLTRLRERLAIRHASKSLRRNMPALSSTEAQIKQALKQLNFAAKRVRKIAVDARGSLPYVASDGNKKVFIKLLSRRHTLADWAFKLWRKVWHRHVEDEVPYMSPKQALEHEAYVATLARSKGIRTPEVYGLIDLGDYRFGLVYEYVDGVTLDHMPKKKLKPRLFQAIWGQVRMLHGCDIAHRDLRAANILIDRKQRPWIIDFDFATTAATPKNVARDNAELLVSLSCLIGAKDAIKNAGSLLKPSDFLAVLPMLVTKHLSAATRQYAKQNPKTLRELRDYIDILSATVNP